jgi:hypothetical protein
MGTTFKINKYLKNENGITYNGYDEVKITYCKSKKRKKVKIWKS